jgi:type II secretory pathway pseudopilin PulG
MMIVIAVVALLVALAIPNLLRARHNANETAAIGAVKTFSAAMESFRAAQTPPTYPVDLAALSAANPPYVPGTLAAATSTRTARQGYFFTYVWTSADAYTLQGTPSVIGTTGSRHFFVDESGLVRANNGAPAGPADPELQ